jgi:hypothetical protein
MPALPSALAGGPAEVHVYIGRYFEASTWSWVPVYVGITNSLVVRQRAHGTRFVIGKITPTPVTRGQAEAIEQAMIVRNPHFQNVNNSISPSVHYYGDAVRWGEAWLKHHGY